MPIGAILATAGTIAAKLAAAKGAVATAAGAIGKVSALKGAADVGGAISKGAKAVKAAKTLKHGSEAFKGVKVLDGAAKAGQAIEANAEGIDSAIKGVRKGKEVIESTTGKPIFQKEEEQPKGIAEMPIATPQPTSTANPALDYVQKNARRAQLY